jgi:sulfur carrier protein ThiS
MVKKKATQKVAKTTIKKKETFEVKIGGFGQSTQILDVEKGTTINEICEQLNLTAAGQKGFVWVNSEQVPYDYEMKKGDSIQIVEGKEGA